MIAGVEQRSRGRILIVEDNRDLADNIAESLVGEGYAPFVTTTATDAIEAAGGVGFDVAFLDVRLPDANGTRTLAQLKIREPDGEVIVMSGDATLESAIATVRGGAFAYILKPFPLDEVLRLTSQAMRQVALRRERESLVHQLRASEVRYRAVVEASPALIVGVGDDGTIALVNAAVERTTGFPRDELLGRPFNEVVPIGAKTPTSRPDTRLQELPIVTRDGSERRIEWRYNHADGLRYAIGVDVTDTRTSERRARVAEHLAVVGELTAGLAHEIRNPLNSALLELEVLGRRLARSKDANNVTSVDTIRGELERLERLLAEFLWFARPGQMSEATLGEVSVPAAAVARLVQADAASRHIRVVTDFAADVPLVNYVEDHIRQVVLNLVRNALDAVDHGGTVTLRTRAIDRSVELQVEDDGPGIKGDPNRVFLPFHTTKSDGTGLGLTLAQRIAADHGGELRVESAPGRTVFTLALPAHRS